MKEQTFIRSLKDTKGNNVIRSIAKNRGGIDLGERKQGRINSAHEFSPKHMMWMKQPKPCCIMSNPKYGENSEF